eukprot:6449573-Pyramimonas_sp.AAC.1
MSHGGPPAYRIMPNAPLAKSTYPTPLRARSSYPMPPPRHRVTRAQHPLLQGRVARCLPGTPSKWGV